MLNSKIIERLIVPGLELLPRHMDTEEARVMLVAIGFQESRFIHRKQIRGPARGFWQFEEGGGIRGVLNHRATAQLIKDVCAELRINPTQVECYEAVAYNDLLACCFARLLLYTLPQALPKVYEENKAWNQYLAAWRPGKPHPETWADLHGLAVALTRDSLQE
jgi:hypothetical protein